MTDPGRSGFVGTAGTGRAVDTARIRDLFARVSEGQASGLEGLYEVCAGELYGLALWRTGSPAAAADVVHDVFVRLALARRALAGVRDPHAYLRRMTHRASVDVHRARARRREEPLGDVSFLEVADPSAPSPEIGIDAERVSRLLARLPAQQREAIFLRHFSGCSYADIARATGVPTFTAASRYRLGIRRLRKLLGVER